MSRAWLLVIVTCVGVVVGTDSGGSAQVADPLRATAEGYVRLVLALGQHDADYVDAYYGPAGWRAEAERQKIGLEEIDRRAEGLVKEVEAAPKTPPLKADAALWPLRLSYLSRQLAALRARVGMLRGARLTFDEESKALYDAVAPTNDAATFETVLATLEAKLPGSGPLAARYEAFKAPFVIPRARLDAVFQAAIRACRDRTAAFVELPPDESFTVEYVTGKPWGGYNWYQGQYRSLIQVNTDLPIYVERAIDLACHEGYPGHHVYNVLLEKHLVRDRGWVEYTVLPLFSPLALIAEGTANYGIEVAFSRSERVQFERDVLFPLAGLDASRAAAYYEVLELTERLSYAGNEAARRYIDGGLDRTGAADWLERYAMTPRTFAEKQVGFFEKYRSYVINYNLGRDLVRGYVERRTRGDGSARARWREFTALLSSPRLPSDLQ